MKSKIAYKKSGLSIQLNQSVIFIEIMIIY